ncbi:MAG TPA: SIS domain-containing protein [Symbiobacteriaceae bacterium]
MPVSMEDFFSAALERVERVRRTQAEPIRRAAAIFAASLRAGGVVHVFGTGHSFAFGLELCHRAGGLVPMDLVSTFDLTARAGEPYRGLEDSSLERDPSVAHRILATHRLEPVDSFLIVSNSGRNGAIVEMALEVKKRNLPLVAVTSMEHTSRVTSRHPSGKRLFELADVVIDNCAPYGDAILEDSRLDGKVCAVSSATGVFIAQALTAEVVRLLLEAGEVPPIFLSANVDGSDERNQALVERYAGRI